MPRRKVTDAELRRAEKAAYVLKTAAKLVEAWDSFNKIGDGLVGQEHRAFVASVRDYQRLAKK